LSRRDPSAGYPDFEVLVGSDGSSDRTNEILQRYSLENSKIRPFLFEQRRGKIPVVNDLVAAAKGELLFFTDADVTLSPTSLLMHVQHYADPTVGGVAGNLEFSGFQKTSDGPLGSEQYYMSFENRLRRHEAELHSTVGIFGGHYSIRKTYWKPLPNEPICDELFIALTIIQNGKRMVFETCAVALEYFGRSMADEFARKTRFASRGFSTLKHFPRLLIPFNGWPSIMLWSHKALRWLSPFAVAALLLATIVGLIGHPSNGAYLTLLTLEAIGALLILGGALLSRSNNSTPILSHAFWFLTMNVAFAAAYLDFY